MSCGISIPFGMLSPSWRQVTHALLTRPPLSSFIFTPKGSFKRFSLDLHVLGTPPAFVLSQDQTLEKIFRKLISSILNTNVFVKFAKTLFGIDKVYTLCNCRNSTFRTYYRFSHCVLFKHHFSKITRFFECPLTREPIYLITPFRFCQPFFKTFFSFIFRCPLLLGATRLY